MEAIGALIPAFAVRLLPKDVSARDHLNTCRESAQYYLNRILKMAKEGQGYDRLSSTSIRCETNQDVA